MLVAKKKITAEKTIEGKEIISPIVSMLARLIKITSLGRVYEEQIVYGNSKGDAFSD